MKFDTKPLRSVFHDKATLILRAMLREPDRAWVVRDFVERFHLGVGWTAEVLRVLRQNGFSEGASRGRNAYSELRKRRELLEEWTEHYQVYLNKFHLCYTHKENVLTEMVKYFKKKGLEEQYALTLHTGANLKTRYVADPNLYLYLNVQDFDKEYLALRQALDLKELKQGGNIYRTCLRSNERDGKHVRVFLYLIVSRGKFYPIGC